MWDQNYANDFELVPLCPEQGVVMLKPSEIKLIHDLDESINPLTSQISFNPRNDLFSSFSILHDCLTIKLRERQNQTSLGIQCNFNLYKSGFFLFYFIFFALSKGNISSHLVMSLKQGIHLNASKPNCFCSSSPNHEKWGFRWEEGSQQA